MDWSDNIHCVYVSICGVASIITA